VLDEVDAWTLVDAPTKPSVVPAAVSIKSAASAVN
jgi:hypothetical protein